MEGGWTDGMSFVSLKCANVVAATTGDATKCEMDSGKRTELNDVRLKTNSGDTGITFRRRAPR